jgi:outer membrane protein TolC
MDEDPRVNRQRIAPLALGAAIAVAGCAAGPNYHTPQIATPPHYAAAASTGDTATTAPAVAAAVDQALWWHALHDPELDSLIERAISGNPDLAIALDRLQAARTFEAAVVGSVLPVAGASAGAGRGTGSDLTRGRADQTLVSADNGAGLTHIN